MKIMGSTHNLLLKLFFLSEAEASGIPSVAVKCVDIMEEHQWRKRLSGLLLTLRFESVGSKQD